MTKLKHSPETFQGKLTEVKIISTRKGTLMAFIEMEVNEPQPRSGILFPEEYERFGDVIHQALKRSCTIKLIGKRDLDVNERPAWIIQNLWQLENP